MSDSKDFSGSLDELDGRDISDDIEYGVPLDDCEKSVSEFFWFSIESAKFNSENDSSKSDEFR